MENYIEEYNAYLMKIKKKHSELNQKLSAVDLEEQDILHFIEFEKCDAVTMMKLMKKLKDVRTRRREIKDEVDKVNAVNARLGGSKLLKEPDTEKFYTYKTSVTEEFHK